MSPWDSLEDKARCAATKYLAKGKTSKSGPKVAYLQIKLGKVASDTSKFDKEVNNKIMVNSVDEELGDAIDSALDDEDDWDDTGEDKL